MLRRVEFIGSGYECVRFVMVDTPTMAEAYEAAEKWYKESGQDFHYCEMEIPKEYAYNESEKKEAVPSGTQLSGTASELLGFLREEYKDSGYMYSGSWPYESLKVKGFDKEVIHELQEAGFIQRRDCDDYAFELSPKERGRLVADHALVSAWYEKVGDAMLLEIQQEARHASSVAVGMDASLVTVDVVKNDGDKEKPERVEVHCPFAVGQVLNLEYDLPRKMRWVGYHETAAPTGTAVGQFMVTYIAHNMLFFPGKNMLEVQSLCEEFNKLYPQNWVMMVFEDELLTRSKLREETLAQKLDSAEQRSYNASQSDAGVREQVSEVRDGIDK